MSTHPGARLKAITAVVKADLSLSVLHYEQGSIREVSNTLVKMTQAGQQLDAQKYPLIAVLGRIVINQPRIPSDLKTCTIKKLVFACLGSKDAKDEQRISTSFDNTLIPLYEQFFYRLSAYPLSHQMELCPYYGKEDLYGPEASQMTDVLDAIVVTNLVLPIT